uniref:Uncharacterized protein n=1 Tax=Glossina pallidipes TaxID=7398 RepID=A0A1A9ZAS2_GLOPL
MIISDYLRKDKFQLTNTSLSSKFVAKHWHNFNFYASIKISLRLGLVFWLTLEALSSEQKKEYVLSPSTINNDSFSNLFPLYRITQRLNGSSKIIDTIDISAPLDVDYDMELAEVNVFRPLFRYRASYARKGSPVG